MRYYELLYIVNPNLEDDRVNKIIDKIGNEINKYKVSIINHNIWGKKRLAYPIKKNKYGIYILLQFSAEQFGFLIEFERSLILNKSVIRHQIVKLDEEPEKVENVELVVDKTDLIEDGKSEILEGDSINNLEYEEKAEDTNKTEKTKLVEKVDESDLDESKKEQEIKEEDE